MKKTAILGILLAALVLLLSGCAELFTFNLFDGMEVVNAGNTVTRVTTSGTTEENLTDIEELLGSDNFTDSLAEDEEEGGTAKQDLLLYLETVATTSDDPAEQQESLVLTADIYTKTTGGDELVNNISNLLTDPTSMQDAEDPADLFETILPESVEDVDDLRAMLLGFTDANDAYESFGSTLDPADESSLEADVNLGDTAQTALIANIVTHAIDDLVTNNGKSEEEAAAALADAILGRSGELPLSADYDPFGGMEEGSGVYNILALSGLESMFGGE